MGTLELALYDNLRKKLDDETARQLISFVKEEIREEVSQNNLVTKNTKSAFLSRVFGSSTGCEVISS